MKTNTIPADELIDFASLTLTKEDSAIIKPELFKYLSTHPTAYREYKEMREDFRRMIRFNH